MKRNKEYYMVVSHNGVDIWDECVTGWSEVDAELQLWSEFVKMYHYTPRLRKIDLADYVREIVQI